MPKKNPKHNPVHVERVNRKRPQNTGSKKGARDPSDYDPWGNNPTDLDQSEEIAFKNDFMRASPKLNHATSGLNRRDGTPRCGLCGKTTNLTKTDCCDQWICDDEDQYVLFSYEQNSCHRNHDRFTLCATHYHEGHAGRWQDCLKCRKGIETEMYVWYGTNEYNFEKLPNPPAYKPTKCAKCKRVIHLGEDGYTVKGKEYFCERCGGFFLMSAQPNMTE